MEKKPNIIIRKPIARNLDSVLNSNPRQRIVMRCVECQTFLLPGELSVIKARYRGNDGRAYTVPFLVCPVCFPTVERIDSPDEIPESHFVTLTREDYEKTKQAEKWGLTYNVKEKRMESGLLIT